LIESIETAGVKPGLVIIDTLAQTLGSGEENGTGMTQFIANANALSVHFAAMVLVVHHVGLADDQRLRGHSSLRGAVEVQILCERVKGTLSTTMTLRKMKEERSDRAFTAQLSRIVVANDPKARKFLPLWSITFQRRTPNRLSSSRNQFRARNGC